jgi:hypothetical protein
MSIFLALIVLLVLALLVLFALLLGGYLDSPEQLKHSFQNMLHKKPDLSGQFRAWSETALAGKPELRGWLASLSEEGFRALTQRVADFCADLNIDLAWLAQGHLQAAPELHEATQTIVTDYLEVCWHAIRRQHDIALFEQFHQLVENTADSRYRETRRQVFTRLIAAGMAEALPSYELIMASETQRQIMAAQAIKQAAAKDWQAFAQLFEDILRADKPSSPA